jgi:hypothetical protein
VVCWFSPEHEGWSAYNCMCCSQRHRFVNWSIPASFPDSFSHEQWSTLLPWLLASTPFWRVTLQLLICSTT